MAAFASTGKPTFVLPNRFFSIEIILCWIPDYMSPLYLSKLVSTLIGTNQSENECNRIDLLKHPRFCPD
jgi:hypothetical protein